MANYFVYATVMGVERKRLFTQEYWVLRHSLAPFTCIPLALSAPGCLPSSVP